MDAIAVAADDPSSVAACGGFDEQRGAHQSSAWQDLPTGIIDGVAACLLGDSAWQPMQSDSTNRAYPGDVQGFSEPSTSCSPARPPSARVRAVCRDWLASHDALLAHLAPVAALPPAGPNLLWATFPRLTSLDLRAQPPSCPLASILSACPTMATLAELWLPPCADDDLMPTLRRTPSLRRLSLRGSKVTDSGLAMLPSLTSLSVLDVGGCAVSDWGLEALAAAAPGLQELCVSELSLLTSEGLRLLSSLRWLRSLDVSGCENVCDAAINVLVAAVPSLTALDVSACWQVSDEGIISLCRLTGLASLTVENCWDVSDVGVRRLAALRSLRCLHLSTWQSLCTSGIPAIASLRHLSTLHISECLVPSDMDVHLLSRLPQLASLSLDCCEMLSDAALSCLGQMACLATLELSDCRNIRDPGIMSLRPLTSLRSLVISGCRQVTDHGLVELLHSLFQLQRLGIQGWALVTDAGLAALQGLKQLTHLDVSYCCNITDRGLWDLSWLPQLDSLDVSGCGLLSEGGLSGVARQLRSLRARGAALSDAGLAAIGARAARLTSLDLAGCAALSDAGLAGLAAAAPRMQALDLRGCHGLSQAGLAMLRGGGALPCLQRLNVSRPLHNRSPARLWGAAASPPADDTAAQ